MAKNKVFTDGELLTASDINTYLNPTVPNDGDLVDTGWIDLVPANNFEQYDATTTPRIRRIGEVVHLRGALTPTVDDPIGGSQVPFLESLPVTFRPTGYAAVFVCQGTGFARWALRIGLDGTVTARSYDPNEDTIGTWLPFAVTYFI